LHSRFLQPFRNAFQDIRIAYIRVIEAGSVDEHDTTTWVIGMGNRDNLDIGCARFEAMTNAGEILASGDIYELSRH
jgi:hypothetical protein